MNIHVQPRHGKQQALYFGVFEELCDKLAPGSWEPGMLDALFDGTNADIVLANGSRLKVANPKAYKPEERLRGANPPPDDLDIFVKGPSGQRGSDAWRPWL